MESIFNLSFQNQDLSSKITTGLERIGEAFRVLLWEHAKVLGISPIQIQILIFVAYHEETLCNVSHLAQEFNLTKPTISDAIRVLEKKGFIEKLPSPTDRRAYSIILTEEGKKICSEIEHFAAPIHNIINTWDEGESAKFFHQLSQLIYGLNQAGILNVQRTCYNCKYYLKREDHHYCGLMETDLFLPDVRLDCPEFETK